MIAVADARALEVLVDTGFAVGMGVAGIVGFVIGIGVYVWYALALSRLFPRLGAEGWKGWVPILNEATILQLGGKPAWNVVFYFLPIVQLYGLYLKIVATHHINVRFGRGAGSTVLAVLLPPVWATLLAWGAPPYPENDRLAGLQPGPRRQPQPGADAAPFGAPQAYLAPPILPAGAPVPPTAGAHLPSAPGGFAPAPPAAYPPAPYPSAPQPGTGFVPQVAPATPVVVHASANGMPSSTPPAASSAPAPPQAAPPAAALPVSSPDQLIDSVPGFGAHPAPAAPVPAPPAAPDPASPALPVTDAVTQTTVPTPPQPVAPTPSDVPAPSAAAPAPPSPASAPASASAPAAAPVPAPTVAPASTPVPVPVPAAEPAVDPMPTPPEARPEQAQAPAPTASDAAFAPPQQFRGSGIAARAAGAPSIRPAPVPLPMPTEPSAPEAATPTIFDEPEALSTPVDDDDFEATVVVSRRRGARRVLVLDDGRTFALSSTSIVIGRNPDGDPGDQRLSIPDKTRTLSKTHARLVVQGDEWRLTDLHSTNGVVVVADDGAETLLDQGESVIGAGRFILGEVGMHVELEADS